MFFHFVNLQSVYHCAKTEKGLRRPSCRLSLNRTVSSSGPLSLFMCAYLHYNQVLLKWYKNGSQSCIKGHPRGYTNTGCLRQVTP